MRVTVQMFARLRELAGSAEVACEVPAGATVGDVWQAVAAEHAALTAYGAAVSCAVNEEFARMTTPVANGDRVAFLPPVSGGAWVDE